ncbi:hypothetical protein B8W90_12025, partial [Staphylococcus hominis]
MHRVEAVGIGRGAHRPGGGTQQQGKGQALGHSRLRSGLGRSYALVRDAWQHHGCNRSWCAQRRATGALCSALCDNPGQQGELD